MAVHPVRSGLGREIEAARFTGLKKRLRHIRDAVLSVRGNLAVPMNDRGLGEIVGQIHPKSLARIEEQPLPVGTSKSENGGRSIVYIERAAGGGQADRSRVLAVGPDGEMGCSKHGCAGGEEAAS